MIKPLYWRINFFLKRQKSKQIRKKLGKNVKYVIAHSENGIMATDPEDLEVVCGYVFTIIQQNIHVQ